MKVTVYSTATCPYCMMTKKWLEQEGVEYEDVRVDEDQQAARKMVELSGQMGVPFTTVEKDDGTMQSVLGYNVPVLTELIKG